MSLKQISELSTSVKTVKNGLEENMLLYSIDILETLTIMHCFTSGLNMMHSLYIYFHSHISISDIHKKGIKCNSIV